MLCTYICVSTASSCRVISPHRIFVRIFWNNLGDSPCEKWPVLLNVFRYYSFMDLQSLRYVAWNVHSPEEGVYRFDGERDLEHFLELIHQVGLLAIVRAGPYICAEWSFGGLPPWLLRKNPTMKLRSSSPDYFLKVVDWFDVLLPMLRKYLYTEGGPVIMVQLENEYGSAGICDHDYMSMLYDLARYHLGPDVILFTTDGASEQLLRCGSKDERYLATIDFGPTAFPPNVSFYPVEHFRPNQPLVNSEFYVGWFDHWGDKHTRTSDSEIISTLTKLMAYSSRVNVNMYMFHGGTTFGFWNGITGGEPVTTSYDFDAPISEAGDITEKYKTLRRFIHEVCTLTFSMFMTGTHNINHRYC
ncbi:hypothetical protein EG68_09202 [Paragonimus skrjabini miyazakii]|uniref:Glycoside hydrolase 35 catalytic domain-containing protein n=1 Tax=Paragonimus skrjabini miyazakii TaxID=59628 RepID=A0A8S9YJI6_9TREM|nr:hypothetical protein EG68_09202 [Paragonimus skrjabini miyazakii]